MSKNGGRKKLDISKSSGGILPGKNERHRKETFLDKRMNKDERSLLKIINTQLAKRGLHIKLAIVRIHDNGSISVEFEPPVERWKNELLEASKTVKEELTKYLSR